MSAEQELLAGPLRLTFYIEPTASPAVVLRQLGAPPSWSVDETPVDLPAPLLPYSPGC